MPGGRAGVARLLPEGAARAGVVHSSQARLLAAGLLLLHSQRDAAPIATWTTPKV